MEHPVSVPEIKAVRLKLGEIIRAAQIQKAERRGPRRYKQVYIVDLSQLSISSRAASALAGRRRETPPSTPVEEAPTAPRRARTPPDRRSLMGSSKCREMAKSIIGGAGDCFPSLTKRPVSSRGLVLMC